MGSSVKKTLKRGQKAVTSAGMSELKPLGRALEKPVRTGATATKKQAAKDIQKQMQKQMQLEKVRSAEAESEIALRRAQAKGGRGGRQSLIKSATGLATNLGGTA
jgi:hypothetical protein